MTNLKLIRPTQLCVFKRTITCFGHNWPSSNYHSNLNFSLPQVRSYYNGKIFHFFQTFRWEFLLEAVDEIKFWFFFFFYWRYNPLWDLAFSVIFFLFTLSSHCFLHPLTPIICKYSSVPAIHLLHGLPLVLVPIGFHCKILLGVLLSSIRIT